MGVILGHCHKIWKVKCSYKNNKVFTQSIRWVNEGSNKKSARNKTVQILKYIEENSWSWWRLWGEWTRTFLWKSLWENMSYVVRDTEEDREKMNNEIKKIILSRDKESHLSGLLLVNNKMIRLGNWSSLSGEYESYCRNVFGEGHVRN